MTRAVLSFGGPRTWIVGSAVPSWLPFQLGPRRFRHSHLRVQAWPLPVDSANYDAGNLHVEFGAPIEDRREPFVNVIRHVAKINHLQPSVARINQHIIPIWLVYRPPHKMQRLSFSKQRIQAHTFGGSVQRGLRSSADHKLIRIAHIFGQQLIARREWNIVGMLGLLFERRLGFQDQNWARSLDRALMRCPLLCGPTARPKHTQKETPYRKRHKKADQFAHPAELSVVCANRFRGKP